MTQKPKAIINNAAVSTGCGGSIRPRRGGSSPTTHNQMRLTPIIIRLPATKAWPARVMKSRKVGFLFELVINKAIRNSKTIAVSQFGKEEVSLTVYSSLAFKGASAATPTMPPTNAPIKPPIGPAITRPMAPPPIAPSGIFEPGGGIGAVPRSYTWIVSHAVKSKEPQCGHLTRTGGVLGTR